jgi:transcriptional regulator with PAS, ATPase and Fis domain
MQETGAMERFPDLRGSQGVSRAGLVLLYAEPHRELPAAWPLAARALIGRDDAADVKLQVHAVSRQHAVLERRGSARNAEYVLRDLGSRNGTFVNGERVTEVVLEEHDEVRIGDAALKFVTQDADAYARYRIDGTLVGAASRLCRTTTELVGGYEMDRIAAHVERIAPCELSVVVLGESGTGKEVVARELHRMSGRQGPFCAVNCAAIPGNLLESELFGYRRGAFSGADRDKPGLVRAADGGTLFLDEIGDMPLEAQAKLLRVIQLREVVPLGATTPERVDVRFVCATHRGLSALITERRFREDLFARLSEDTVLLPPLRERKEDVFALTRTFLERHGRAELEPNLQYWLALLHYDWPYNVRELESCVKRSIAVAQGVELSFEQLPLAVQESMRDYGAVPSATPSTRPRSSSLSEPAPEACVAAPGTRPSSPPVGAAGSTVGGAPTETELRALLAANHGNVAQVGKLLGKARMQIHRWMKRYGISADEYRA